MGDGMIGVALACSLLIAALGVVGVAAPGRLLALVGRFQSPNGLYAAALIRIFLGCVFFFAAPASRAPEAVRVLGIFVAVAGIVTPVFGLERFERLLEWWSQRGTAFVRVWASAALAFGLCLLWAFLPS